MTDEVVPMTKEAMPMMQEVVPMMHEAVPMTDEAVPMTDEVVPMTKEAMPMMQEVVPMMHEAVPMTDEAVPTKLGKEMRRGVLLAWRLPKDAFFVATARVVCYGISFPRRRFLLVVGIRRLGDFFPLFCRRTLAQVPIFITNGRISRTSFSPFERHSCHSSIRDICD